MRWRETLDVQGAETLARFDNGDAALVAADNHHYLACWPDEKLLNSVVKRVTAKAQLKTLSLPGGIRLRRRGNLLFAFNYGNKPWKLAAGKTVVLGKREIQPQEVTIVAMS